MPTLTEVQTSRSLLQWWMIAITTLSQRSLACKRHWISVSLKILRWGLLSCLLVRLRSVRQVLKASYAITPTWINSRVIVLQVGGLLAAVLLVRQETTYLTSTIRLLPETSQCRLGRMQAHSALSLLPMVSLSLCLMVLFGVLYNASHY